MTEKQHQPGSQHPEEWRQDLNPDPLAGQNAGQELSQSAEDAPTAYDLKEIHRQFHGFSDDELKRVAIVPRDSRLKQGATYVDLQDPSLREFTATGDMKAGQYNWYVAKSETDYQLWNRLIGIDNPERLGEADDS